MNATGSETSAAVLRSTHRTASRRSRIGALAAAIWLGSMGVGVHAADTLDSLFEEPEPESMDELFTDETDTAGRPDEATAAKEPATPAQRAEQAATHFGGFFENKLAYTYARPKHWSLARNTLELSLDGSLNGMNWKVSGRAVWDPVFDFEDYYPHRVKDDQQFEASVRETYIDVSRGDLDLRIGRQHIVWGEMVGLFFADVVSAKDMRELVLQEFDILRIPQWAVRAEYFKDELHAEFVWIPYMTYNEVGEPGAEFFDVELPDFVPAQNFRYRRDRPHALDDGAYGVRFTYLLDGWDLSAFHYNSRDAMPAFARTIGFDLEPFLTLREVHERIAQTGATLAKDFGSFVLKAEAIYTRNKPVAIDDPADADGLLRTDLLDYVVGLEWAFANEGRFNLQFFQRWFPDHERTMVDDDLQSGLSLLLSRRFGNHWEPELLWITSVDHSDSLLRAKLKWLSGGNWNLTLGVDVFDGDPGGMFGNYDTRDRVYTELRLTF